jgi:hypothetical protein
MIIALVHLLDKDKDYANFFYESKTTRPLYYFR